MIEYSDKLIEHASQVFGLGKSKVIVWSIRMPFLWDVKRVFEHTEEENQELIDYYKPFLKEGMSKKEQVKAIALVVNKRITYEQDLVTYTKVEWWARPIEVHRKQVDDCDGYAVLICYVLRLLGFAPWEIFVRAGDCVIDDGTLCGHAHVMWFDYDVGEWYPVEGSFYPNRCLNSLGVVAMRDNANYGLQKTWFITNDKLSYSGYPLKLVR